jgi:outer membrane receptor for ferrienterochelin and colicins
MGGQSVRSKWTLHLGRTPGHVAPATLLALASLLWPSRASGQIPESLPEEEQALEQLDLQALLKTPVEVWTAAKTPQSRYEAPAIITTVTREQIEVWGYRSLAELLSHHLGFYAIDDHESTNLAVRGNSGGLYSDSSIIKVLINGQPIPFASTGGTGLGPELIPLSAVERVEIIRGPASAIYGANAFLGMVNIRTRGGKQVNGVTAWLAGGLVKNHPSTDLDASIGTARGWMDAMVAVRYNKQDLSGLALPVSSPAPRVPAYHIGPLVAEGLDQESLSVLGTLTLRPRPGWSAGLLAYYSQRERGSEFGSIFQLAHGLNEKGVFSENRVSRNHLRVALQLEGELSSRLRLSLRSSYFQGVTAGDDHLEVGNEFYFVRRPLGFRGVDADAHADWTLTNSLSLSGGGNLIFDREKLPSRVAVAKQRIEGVGVNPGEVIEAASVFQGHRTFRDTAAYLQGNWRPLGEKLGLTAGLRYDYHNVYKGQLTRRVGVVSSPISSLHLKLLHGSAFQAPSPFLMHAVPLTIGDVAGNPELEPQSVNTVEFQVEFEPTRWLNLSSEAAYNILQNKTEFIQQGINLVARNVLRTTTISWESRVEAKFGDLLQAHVSAELDRTVTSSEEKTYLNVITGDQGEVYPQLIVHSGVATLIRNLLRVAVTLSYFGERRSSGTNTLLNRGPYELPHYLLMNATLTTRGFKLLRAHEQEISFSVSGKNLLNVTGPTPGFSGVDYPLSPRAFFFQTNLAL